MAKKLGYVDTLWGRRRHLPDLQLEPFEVYADNDADRQFILNQLNNAKSFK